ncbi:MAG TPA: PAS domain-containing protein, partial [Anaerolineaceae bacterium]|nr:PAS domain-containing protein [Anaerolineaceae bacterium]
MPKITSSSAASLDRLELIMRGINDGIWDWNLRTNAVYFSPRWKEMLGYAADEFEDRLDAWQSRIHPDDFNRVLSSMEQHFEGLASPSGLEYRLRHRDGSYRWILSRAVAVLDENGVPYRMVGSHTDITERKRIELSLRESENNLRLLLENAENFVVYRIAVDPANPYGGRVVMVSPSIRDITGTEEPYRYESWFEDIHPDDQQRAMKASAVALASGLPYKQETRVFNRGKQAWVWLQTISNPVFDSEGRLTHFNGLIIDITAQKLAQEALAYQLAFEKLVTGISTEFINLPPDQVDDGIRRALQLIGEFSGVDRSYLFMFSDDRLRMRCTTEWCAPGIEPQIEAMRDVPVALFHWSNDKILAQDTLHIPRVADLPAEARVEKEEFTRQQIQSLVAVPMAYQGKVAGFLGFDAVLSEKIWSAHSLALLKIVGEIFINALEHKRAQAIQAGQRQYLELLASGKSLPETLHALVSVIEEQSPGMLGLILLLDPDGQHLHVGATGRLSQAYADSIEGLAIGPLVGSCGTACYSRQMVVVEDILGDPRWNDLRDLAVSAGLRACWSQPVMDASGQVLGTFAMYYQHPRSPSEDEMRIIQTAAHLVGIAIEHERAQAAVKQAYQVLERRVEERTRDLERRRQVAEGLRDILAFLNSNRPLQETLDFITDQARRLMGAYSAVIHRLDMERNYVTVEAASGLPADLRDIHGFPLNLASRADVALLNRQPVATGSISPELIAAVETDPSLMPEIRQWRRSFYRVTRAFLAVPLIVAGETYGSFAFYFAETQTFDDEQLRLAHSL